MPKGLSGVVKRKRLVNDGRQLALVDPLRQRGPVVAVIRRHVQDDLVGAAAQERRAEQGGQGRGRVANVPTGGDDDEDAPGEEDAAGGAGVQAGRVAADIVGDEAEDAPAGDELGDDVGGRVVDDVVGAEGAAQRGLGGRARHGDVAAQQLGDLDAKGADAAGAAVDEDLIAGPDVRLDALVGREPGGAHGGGHVRVHGAREPRVPVARDRHVLGQGAGAAQRRQARHDAVADEHVRHGAARRDDLAAEVHAHCLGEGEDGPRPEAHGRHFVVGWVDGRADDADLDLGRLEGRRWARDRRELECVLDLAGRGELPCLHVGHGDGSCFFSSRTFVDGMD